SEYNLSNPSHLDLAAQAYGFQGAKDLANQVRAAVYTPFEMRQHAGKAEAPAPKIIAASTEAGLTPSAANLKAAIQAVANRYPRIMGLIKQFQAQNLPKADWLAQTFVSNEGNIVIDINT